MRRALSALALLVALLFGLVAAAQEAPAPVDYSAFGQVATRAERVLEAGRADDAALEALRAELATWRSRLMEAENANAARIERLQAQLDALGPAPDTAAGASEPEEIAARRAELAEDLAEAQVPRVNALEAYNRTTGLIAEIDTLIRTRQNEALLERSPAPVLPQNWVAAAEALAAVGTDIMAELGAPLADPERRTALRDRTLGTLPVLVVGLLLLVRGRRWVLRLANIAHRRNARETLVFLVSLGQVVLPVLGAILLLAGVAATGIVGDKLTGLLGGLIGLLYTTVAALWLGGRLFPPEDQPAALDLTEAGRTHARRISVAIGVLLGVGSVLSALTGFEEVGQGARAVIFLPYLVALAWCFWSLSGDLRAGHAKAAGEGEEARFAARVAAILALALRVVAVAGPLLALAGYVNAAEGLMRPTALSLGLIALFVALQVPIRDIYALATKTPVADAGRALVPVLVNFGLALLALPVLALIWGMRATELDEVYSRFMGGFSLGGARITPGDILTVILVFALALLATRLVQGALKSTVLPRTKMDIGAQNAIASGIGYVGIAIAALLAVNAGGIDLTALAFVLSALSVGIGFGLQNVVQNFVAGIILLIERPIGEGDWIEVGGNMGIVKSISVRSTVIETFDKQQLIVPNGDFITGTVTNWTRGNQVGRAVVQVGVAYGTDTRRVQAILLEIARGLPGIMPFPEPAVDFLGFGADSLDFRVRVLLYDVNTLLSVKTELHHRIAERFTAEGIEIPFAQRDIWLRNPEALRGGAPEGDAA